MRWGDENHRFAGRHEASRAKYLETIDRLAVRGAEAVTPGCTEIGMPVEQGLTEIKLYDTSAIHAAKAVALAIEGEVARGSRRDPAGAAAARP